MKSEAQSADSQATRAAHNARISQLNHRASLLYVAAGAAGAVGATLLLWPAGETRAVPVAGGGSTGLMLQGAF